jgi:ribosomal-protein-alanine N-acetyltransferase
MTGPERYRLGPPPKGYETEIATWPLDPLEAEAWCSEPLVPVPDALVTSWAEADDTEVYGIFDAQDLLGYGELWVDHAGGEVEIARLIVRPPARRRGVGLALTRLLLECAREKHPDHAVFLRVRPDNTTAIGVYLRAGFEPVDAALAEEWNQEQPHPYIWMQARPDSS